MQVLNESATPLYEVRPLIEFVKKHTAKSYFAYLHLKELPNPAPIQCMGGFADKEAGTYFSLRILTPSVVTLWIHRNKSQYPIQTCHRVSVGKVELTTWEEEFVFVLAHELRHIDQFWGKDAAQPEVDAERHALTVLNEYRKSLGKSAVVVVPMSKRRTTIDARSTPSVRARKTKSNGRKNH